METLKIQWEYEDELPEDIDSETFKAMFAVSQVIGGVRMYPYVSIYFDDRYYLTK